MTDKTEAMVAEMMKRQEALMSLGHALCDRVESLSDQIAELLEQMNRPADGSLEDSIKQLTEAMKAAAEKPKGDLGEWIKDTALALHGVQKEMRELPARVARAVSTGEV